MVGTVPVGGGAPVTVQSMTVTKTADHEATLQQIYALAAAGADIVRCTCNRPEAAEGLARIVPRSPVPIVADIHNNHRMALAALEAGVHCLRLNPGNIRKPDQIKAVARECKDRGVPIRIGVNGGSLDPDLYDPESGVTPEAVDYVLCTHLHVDHVGWNTRLLDGRWVPTFPNARYLFDREEWEFWQAEYRTGGFTDDPFYEDGILPVIAARQADFVSGDREIDRWVRLEPSRGHTPGHVCVRIRDAGSEAVMTGDMMHHPLQCAEPALSSCFCVDPEQSHLTRRIFLERHADGGILVLPAHFPSPTGGRVKSAGETFRFAFDRDG